MTALNANISSAHNDQRAWLTFSRFQLPEEISAVDLNSSHVIPTLVRKCLEARDGRASEIALWGDGWPTREFLYVDDAAEAIVMATLEYDGGDPVNIAERECGFKTHTSPNGGLEKIIECTRRRGDRERKLTITHSLDPMASAVTATKGEVSWKD